MDLGADVIGGCCEVGVKEISKMRAQIDKCNSKARQEHLVQVKKEIFSPEDELDE